MSREPQRPFARVYYLDLQADYREVWFDPTCLSTYVRLLVLAEQAWPGSPDLPRAVRRADLAMLTNCGLITLSPDGLQFRVKGYDAERAARQGAAKASADVRWASKRTATAMRPHSDRIASTSTSTSTSTRPFSTDVENVAPAPVPGDRVDDPVDALFLRTGRFPTGRIKTWVEDIGKAHGDARACAAIAEMPLVGDDVREYLRAIQDKLRADDRKAERAERTDEVARNAAKRRPLTVAKPVEDISDEEAERLAREWRTAGGVA